MMYEMYIYPAHTTRATNLRCLYDTAKRRLQRLSVAPAGTQSQADVDFRLG